MKLHLILDFALVAVAFIIIYRCWRQGLVASLVRLGGTIGAYVCAWVFSTPISAVIYDTFLGSRLLRYANSIVPPELHTLPPELVAAATQFPEVKATLTGAINTALSEAGLDRLPFRLVQVEGAGDRLIDRILDGGTTVAEGLVEVIMKPAALTLTRIVVFIVLFAIVSAVVAVLFRLGMGVNHIPLLGGLNRLAGGAVGLVEAAITLYILALLLFMAATLLRSSSIALLQPEVLERSHLLTWIMQWRLPAGFMMFSI